MFLTGWHIPTGTVKDPESGGGSSTTTVVVVVVVVALLLIIIGLIVIWRLKVSKQVRFVLFFTLLNNGQRFLYSHILHALSWKLWTDAFVDFLGSSASSNRYQKVIHGILFSDVQSYYFSPSFFLITYISSYKVISLTLTLKIFYLALAQNKLEIQH